MKCSHTGHPFPHRLLLFLTQGNWTPTKLLFLHNLVTLSPPREDYQPSLTTLGDYHPLKKIITSLSLQWGIITPSSLQPLPWEITNRDKVWPVVLFKSTSCLTTFPHNYSGSVVCFHSKGYGLGTLMARNCTKKTLIHSPLLLLPNCERLKGISRNIIIVNQPTARPSMFHYHYYYYYY